MRVEHSTYILHTLLKIPTKEFYFSRILRLLVCLLYVAAAVFVDIIELSVGVTIRKFCVVPHNLKS